MQHNHLLLHKLFESQVENNPKKTAVISDGDKLSYRQLDIKSNQLANAIKEIDSPSDTFIAIVMESGIEQSIAIFGILKAGYAYVPIDATYPRERVQSLVADVGASIVITQTKFLDSLSSLKLSSSNKKVRVISADDSLENYPSSLENPINKSPDDLAYGIFTSGTTGKPKLVTINHKGAINTIFDINKKYNIDSTDTVLALSKLDFDLSVYDYFGLMAVGGTVVVPNQDKRKDPSYWLDLISKNKITLWNSVPMLLEMLAEYTSTHQESAQAIKPLRLFLLSGDYIPVSLPDAVRSLHPDAKQIRIVSLGGATECSIWSIYYEIGDVDKKWKSIPYGKPLTNQDVQVLNSNYQICPPGVTGDIYISGVGLATGYWQNPEETDNRFIEHPITKDRVYKTGDKGRYFLDGNIEFLGRVDNQVKVSGHRIELGEIEYYLNLHESVKQAVVDTIVYENRKVLVAFLIKRETLSVDAIKVFLAEKVPSYMQPTAYYFVDTLPLTTNGKVDRKALTKIASEGTYQLHNEYVPPRNERETKISMLWKDILKLNKVGVYDRFYSLGGNSLLTIQLANRIEQVFDIKASIIELIRAETVEQQARFIQVKQEINVCEPELA